VKLLLSAYSCAPGIGSESEVGFRTALAAATHHDVWVLTRQANLPQLTRALAGHPLGPQIRVEGLDFEGPSWRMKQRGNYLGLHWYYDEWQRRAADVARRLDRQVGFDLVHHVTFASYWTRAGVAELGKPFVWGPLGGGLAPPLGLMAEMGWRGLLADLTRLVVRQGLGRATWNRRARQAAGIVLVQNRSTGRRFGSKGEIRVVPNALAVEIDELPAPTRRSKEIVVVGRLITLKAGPLAVRALRYVADPDAVLSFYGAGPDRARIERRAHRWGLVDRVRFLGWRPREELLRRVAGAGVFLHTSLHEEGGLAVAEALSMRTPVVCLRHGGPQELVGRWADSPAQLVDPSTPDRTARRLARAVDGFLADPPPPVTKSVPEASYGELILQAYEDAVGPSPQPPPASGRGS
jgi:glycosyltransferase involved in cell wall biosynthesis